MLTLTWLREESMDEAPVIYTGKNSPEEVALKLLHEIAHVENIGVRGDTRTNKPDRKWILDTYAECLDVVRNPHVRVRLIKAR
jgi:hypothetical protein